MNQREMVMAAATGAIVVTALGWTFVVRPTIERWTTARDRVETLREQAAKAASLVARKGELESEQARIRHVLGADAATSDLNFRNSAHDAFLEHLDELTKAAGFSAADLKYVRTEALESYAELRFELRARAPLKQIVDFLVRMTAGESYLRVQAITIQPKDGGQVEADLSLVGLVSQDVLDESELPPSARKGAKK